MSQLIDRTKMILLAILAILALFAAAGAQQYPVWTDSVAVSTVAKDSAFAVRWEAVTIKFVGCAGWIKVGTPDTSSWSSRDWFYCDSDEPISFGVRTPLKRMEFKAASGSGHIYFIGEKKSARF